MYKSSVASVFSGIGYAEYALKKINVDFDIKFACDANPYCKQTYLLNHEMDSNHWYPNIESLNGEFYKDEIDLLIGMPPIRMTKLCSFGGAGWDCFMQFARIVKEAKPRTFLCCTNGQLTRHDGNNSIKLIKNMFYGLGYACYYKALKAKNFNCPLNKVNSYIVGSLEHELYTFPTSMPRTTEAAEFLSKSVPENYHFTETQLEYVKRVVPKRRVNRVMANELTRTIDRHNIVCTDGRLREITPLEMLAIKGFEPDFKLITEGDVKVKSRECVANALPVPLLKQIFENMYI